MMFLVTGSSHVVGPNLDDASIHPSYGHTNWLEKGVKLSGKYLTRSRALNVVSVAVRINNNNNNNVKSPMREMNWGGRE